MVRLRRFSVKQQSRTLLLTLVKKLIRLQFPTVRRINSEELAERLAIAPATPLQILDTRGKAEYAVSHLEGAERVSGDFSLQKLSKTQPIVVYCSVGYRSARVAQALQKAGFSQVFNLEGGLFQWANEGRPMVQNGRPTRWVHPYNNRWGKLLEPEHRLSEFEPL